MLPIVIGILRSGGNLQIISILTLLYIFAVSDGWLSRGNNLFARILSLIGRNTLAIYFIHYFLLFRVPVLPRLLESMRLDSVTLTHSCDSLVEFVTVGTLAIVISLASVGIAKILGKFPLAYTLCLGR